MKTVLLVDDNDELRGATGEILVEMGYAVTTAAQAEEALGNPGGFDLLISDVYMPGMNGVELADRLLSRQPELAILLVSSHGGEPEVRHRLARGDIAFLSKPFSPSELTAKVQDAFDRIAERRNAEASREPPKDSKQRHASADSPFRVPKGALLLVGAIALVLGLGALLRGLEFGAPPLPAPRTDSITRSATIEIVQPLGPLAVAPAQLVWLPVDGAATYAASLRTIDGSALWQTTIRDSPADVPAEITRRLHPAVTYYWSVEALDAENKQVGRSELAPFVIELAPREPV